MSEGTHMCICNRYPHTPECIAVRPDEAAQALIAAVDAYEVSSQYATCADEFRHYGADTVSGVIEAARAWQAAQPQKEQPK